MPAALKPLDEVERLEALRSWKILDSARDEAFDDIVLIAAKTFGVPVGLVTLIDDDRQWFKAAVGLEGEETPREHAVCAHAILEPSRPLVVPDTDADERFRDNPVLRDAGLRFYAGAPLVDPGGKPLGTVCVLGSDPLDPNEDLDDRLEILEALSRQAMRLIEHRAAARRLADALGRVRALEELVPICAWCQRVRNDEDYWATVQDFLKSRGAELTHGICPDCFEKLVPEEAESGAA